MNAIEYINKLTTGKKNKVNKLTVREVEEETKNNFIAFVDDELHSFDVKIQLVENQIINAFCDCESKETYCLHKTAVLLNLLDNEPTTTLKSPRKKKTVKLNEAQEILKQLDNNEISTWLSMVLSNNKEIEMQFLLHFSKKTLSYEVADIEKLIVNSFTSIMLKRKKIELNELKKILELLNKVLAPVFDYLQTEITQQKSLTLLSALVEALIIQEGKYTVPGTRYEKYIRSLIEKFALLFNNVQDEDAWKKQVKAIVDDFFNTEILIGTYATDLLAFTHSFAQTNRKKFISECIKKNLLEYIEDDFTLRLEFNSILLDIVTENNDFEAVNEYFTIYPYENAFNIKFLNALKNINPELTIAYCSKCISSNSKIDYNLPYLLILEEIFTSQNNLKNLALVKHDKFQIDPNFEDYQFIQQHLDDKEYLSKFRVNTLSRFRNLFYKEDVHVDIYFEILHNEQNYKKMLEVIEKYMIPFRVLNRYLDILFNLDHISLLQNIFNRLIFIAIEEQPNENFNETQAFVVKHYSQNDIQLILNDGWFKKYSFYPKYLKLDILEKFKV